MINLDAETMARRKRQRERANHIFTGICWAAAATSVLILIVLLVSILQQGLKYLDWSFVTGLPSRHPEEAGMWPPIAGSIIIVAICGLTALPLGVGTAIFLEEYKPKHRFARKLHGFVQLNISNLAGVPSIVYGIIGLTVFVSFFNLFGTANDPAARFGVQWYDIVADAAGNYLSFARESEGAPTIELSDGLTVETDAGKAITLDVVNQDEMNAIYDRMEERLAAIPEGLSDEAYDQRRAEIELEALEGVIPPDPYIGRDPVKTWYYVQIPFGRGVLAGGLTLMLVILPIVIVSSQEAIRAVPPSLREGAFGLGATKWQVIQRTVLPASIPGIMTGSILALSRAIGEAAPILILAGIVYITFTPKNLMDDFTAMPLQIFHWAGLPSKEFHMVAASGIIILLGVLLSFNAVAVLIRQKFQKPLQ